ncbi:hypothetical protein [Paraburkholderia dioscoreae]|uniref:Uncharacterized protein n=1 Tax=Paraburkholderia dioscoreae TaxID=2604047 RepID=A0A5Q4YTI8_9BURK|nr:hypothetical protein [Paraburkholderia dioscoreae]VVD29241.1 conserved protein of unknown function [Paraburkholderia dioscoreae]
MSAPTLAMAANTDALATPTAGAAPRDTSSATDGGRPFFVQIVDALGLWGSGNELPDFGSRVAWRVSADADATPDSTPDATPDFVIRVATDLEPLAGRRGRPAGVSVLVDSVVPIGARGCGPILACPHDEVRSAVETLAQAVFRVALADQVVLYEWSEIEELLRGDCLVLVRSLPAASPDAFAAAAIGAVAYFQGRTRIEPEGLLLGLAAPGTLPLVQRRDFTRPLLALAGHHCAFLAGVHTHRGQPPEAALLLTFPMPRLPGEDVRAQRARRP